MAQAIPENSYITVLIYAHGQDLIDQPIDYDRLPVHIRKLTIAGRSGSFGWGLPIFPEGIFHRFQSAKLANPSMRFDRLLQVVRDQLRDTAIPDELQTAVESYHQDQSDRNARGMPLDDYVPHVMPQLSDWFQFTSASYDHNYDFNNAKGMNFGIWILDSNHVGLSLKKPKDIYHPETKSQNLDWQVGPSILTSAEMVYRGAPASQAVRMTTLAQRLRAKYQVANVNFIDISCRYVAEQDLPLLDDKVASALVTATPRVAGVPNVKRVTGIGKESKPLPLGWVEHVDHEGMIYYYNPRTGETSWIFPSYRGGKKTSKKRNSRNRRSRK